VLGKVIGGIAEFTRGYRSRKCNRIFFVPFPNKSTSHRSSSHRIKHYNSKYVTKIG